jgi:hypothetical protein
MRPTLNKLIQQHLPNYFPLRLCKPLIPHTSAFIFWEFSEDLYGRGIQSIPTKQNEQAFRI